MNYRFIGNLLYLLIISTAVVLLTSGCTRCSNSNRPANIDIEADSSNSVDLEEETTKGYISEDEAHEVKSETTPPEPKDEPILKSKNEKAESSETSEQQQNSYTDEEDYQPPNWQQNDAEDEYPIDNETDHDTYPSRETGGF